MGALNSGSRIEVDGLDRDSWTEIVARFRDASLYQTWDYGSVRWGEGALSHLVLRQGGEIVAAAQVRIVKVPVVPVGVAYVAWGPMWRRTGCDDDPEVLQEALRALREEYVARRRLLLRLRCPDPANANGLGPILAEEGYAHDSRAPRRRTILIDLRRNDEDLRKGFTGKWRRDLTRSEKNDFEIEHGSSLELYDEFLALYREMMDLKQFDESVDVDEFRKIQEALPPAHQTETMVCRCEGRPVSAVVVSGMGDTALLLFAATNREGREKGAAYYIKWRELLWLKGKGYDWYDFGGVNPEDNPGVYRAKRGVLGKNEENGREITRAGDFNAGRGVSAAAVGVADLLQRGWRTFGKRAVGALRPSHG